MAEDIVRKNYGRGYCLSSELKKEIAILYQSGLTAPKIGKKLNVGRSAVYNALEEMSVKCRSHGYSRNKSIGIEKEIIDVYNGGLSASDTGKKFGMDEGAVLKCLRRMSAEVRPIGKHDASKSPNWKGGISKTIEYKRAKCKKFTKLYRETKPLFKLALTLRSRVGEFFRRAKENKAMDFKKRKSTIALIGADIATVFAHIESQFQAEMTWDNHGSGRGKWHIDHCVPLASAKTIDELESLFHYTNLQPLWQEENHRKHAKLDWIRSPFRENKNGT